MAGGTGSIQITGFETLFSFYASLQEGERLVAEATEEGRPAAVQEWSGKVLANFKSEKGASSDDASGLALDSSAFMTQMGEAAEAGEMRVVLISGFYYLAVAAGLVKQGETDYLYQQSSLVREKLMALQSSTTKKPKDVANAARLLTLLDALFGSTVSKVRFLFTRDWVLAGRQFRTTWSAG